ncbi:MAG: hypothetical protein N2316_08600 [Spirochaetes bacterium]|nr:hypothetical protein [Spirochaetota bacterium]
MKKFFFFVTISLVTIMLIFVSTSTLSYANFNIPLSLSYASTYWWRGVELNGRSIGMLWLGAGLELGNSGFSANVYSGISQDYLSQTDDENSYSEFKKVQKAKTEIDYGINFERAVSEIFTIGAGLYFINYPYYEEDPSLSADPSFIEASLSLGAKTILNPKLSLYYDYYIEENSQKTPVNEDYYINISLTQPILQEGGFSFSAGCWIGYYNNAYLNATGFSDAGISASFSFVKDTATFTSSLFYARSLTSDFQVEYESVGVLKNHIWVEFEAIYKL